MKYFDLHADTVYRCLGENLAFDDNALNVTAQKAAVFDEWHQCFPVFINDGIDDPFGYYKKAVAFLKNEFQNKPQNLTPILTVEGGFLVKEEEKSFHGKQVTIQDYNINVDESLENYKDIYEPYVVKMKEKINNK